MNSLRIVPSRRERINHQHMDALTQRREHFVRKEFNLVTVTLVGGLNDLHQGDDAITGRMPNHQGAAFRQVERSLKTCFL